MNSFSQSDSGSTGATKSLDDRLGTKLTDSPRSDRSRASGSPDGESPKGFGHERLVTWQQQATRVCLLTEARTGRWNSRKSSNINRFVIPKSVDGHDKKHNERSVPQFLFGIRTIEVHSQPTCY